MRNRTRISSLDAFGLRDQRDRIYPALEASDGSTLSLDFTSMGGALDSRFTFSRSSTATFINSSGLVQYADANLILQSESLATSPWAATNGASVADVSTTNPVGGSTATQLTSGGANNSVLQGPSLAANVPHTVRFWVRGGTSTQMQFGYFSGSFQTASGITVVGSGSVTGTGLMTITGLSTTTWTQVTFVLASPAASGSLLFYPDTASPTVGRTNFVWGVQINAGSTASAYNRTTTAAYHAPRFNYDPTTLAPRGLLIESSVTNELQRSNEFNTSPWYTTNFNTPTIASPSVTDPAGGTNTWYCVPSGTGLHGFRYNTTFTAVAYTFSIWAKAAQHDKFIISDGSSGQGACRFDLTAKTANEITGVVTPTNPQIIEYPNGWFRCSFTMVMAAATRGMTYSSYPTGATISAFGATFTASGSDGMYFYGAQTEISSGASSYIPTGASTVQRAADLCQMTGTNFSSWFGSPTSATVYAEAFANIIPPASNFPGVWLMNKSGTARNYGFVRHTNGALRVSGFNAAIGGSLVDIETTPNTTVTAGVRFKQAVAMADLNWSYAANAGTGVNTGSNATVYFDETVDSLTIGLAPTQLGSNTIAKLKYWPVALPTATLQALTT